MPDYITNDIEISSGDSDREDSGKKNLMKKVLMKETLMKKVMYRMRLFLYLEHLTNFKLFLKYSYNLHS